jgi:hypothetical protein
MRGVSREPFIGEELRCANGIFPHKQNLENGLRPVSAAPAIVSYHYKGKSIIRKLMFRPFRFYGSKRMWNEHVLPLAPLLLAKKSPLSV